MNRFSSACKSERTRSHKFRGQKRSNVKNNRRIKKTTEDVESTSSDAGFFGQAVEHLKQAKKIIVIGKNGDNYRTVMVRLNDVDVLMEADSGADINIMDEHQSEVFSHRTHDEPILANSYVKLRTLQHKLEVKGEFQTVIRNETCGEPTKFVVVPGRIQSPPLISKETLIALGMLKIQPDGSFAEPNDLAISEKRHNANTVEQAKGEQDRKDLTTKYNHLFQGIGRIEDKKNGREILSRFHMKPGT